MRWAAALLAAALCAQVEAPAPSSQPVRLEYAGRPLRLPSPCSEEDIRDLALTCPAEHPCPVYLELADFERVGERILLAGNLHTEAATLTSVLLLSEDGGKSWYEPHERIRSAGLDQIQFLDLEAGFIAGYVLHALPRDPFLLLTSDGGKTWRRRPLWAESKIGVIEHYYFEDRRHGWLWMDRASPGDAGRYELYESMTGGESWMLRQISDRPIPKKGQPAVNPDWRLRADPATKSYLLERRTPKWQVVAAFLIQAGECKEPELPVPEPPEPVQPPEAKTPPEAPAPKPPLAPHKPPSLKRKPQ